MKWQWILGGFVGLVIASVIGGVIFHFLEAGHESDVAADTRLKLADFIAKRPCINASHLLMAQKMLKLIKSAGVRVGVSDSMPIDNITNWDLESSIFLAFQVMGSVGYGNAPPVTTSGRVFCVFYMLFGIPLFIIASYGVGQMLSQWVDAARKSFYRRAWRCRAPDRCSRHGVVSNLLSLFLVGFTLFILIPAAIFYALETWTYGEAIYCAVITTLTIGFSDFVPGQDSPDSYRKVYRVLVGVWIICDLYWFAGLMTIVRDAFNFADEVIKPLDVAIHEQKTTDSNGQKKIRFDKNWKKKFDRQWKQQTTTAPANQNTAQPARTVMTSSQPDLVSTNRNIAAISHVDVVPVYAPSRLYPSVIGSAVDSRLTVFTPTVTSSAVTGNNVSQVKIGS